MSEGALSCQRDAFSLPKDLHYLNCAYMSPLPRAVEEAGVQGISRKRNPSVLETTEFFEESQEVRRLFARLINAPDPNAVAIIPSVSYGIGVAAKNTPLAPGQNVVLLEEQFPGNVYGWRRLAWERGGEIRVVGPDMLMAAMTRPLSSRIGAATHRTPFSFSSSSTAYPEAFTCSR